MLGARGEELDLVGGIKFSIHTDFVSQVKFQGNVKWSIGNVNVDVNPKLDTRISVLLLLRHARTTPPLDSETGWTGELRLKTNLLNWQN